MSVTTAPNLGIHSGWNTGDDGWGDPMNDNLDLIDVVAHLHVISATTSVPPLAPAEGDRYIVPSNGTGVWVTLREKVVVSRSGFWRAYTAREGWTARVRDMDNASVVFDGLGWGVRTMSSEFRADYQGIVGKQQQTAEDLEQLAEGLQQQADKLVQEAKQRDQGMQELAGRLEVGAIANGEALAVEAQKRAAGLAAEAEARANDIRAEGLIRAQADAAATAALVDGLTAEAQARAGDLRAEALDRAQADAALADGLAAEATRRAKDVAGLSSGLEWQSDRLNDRIDTVSAQVSDILGTEEYDPDAEYLAGAIVKLSGKLYRAEQTVPAGTPPPNSAYWELLGEYASLGELVGAQALQISDLTTRVTANAQGISAEATERNTLAAQLRGNYAGNDPALLTQGLIYRERQARVSAEQAFTSDLSSVSARLGEAEGKAGGQAMAITDLQASVSRIDGVAESNSQQLVTLSSSLEGLEENTSTAISGLNTRVTASEQGLVAQSTDITTLKNRVGDVESGAGAMSTAISGLTSRVEGNESGMLSQSGQISSLGNRLTSAEGLGSANSTAIAGLQSKVTDQGGVLESHGSHLVSLTNDLADLDGALADKASSSALQALDSRVTSAEGVNTSQSGSITSLQNDLTGLAGVVDTKASSAALSSLQSTVTGQGNTITSQGTSLTTLTNKVNHATTGLDAKASSAALASLDSKVTTQGNTITSQGTAITNLQNDLDTVEGDVATKASAAALTALTSRVTAAEGVNTSQSDSLTSLGNRMTTAEGTISSTSSALSSLTSRVTAAEGVNTSQATSITNLNTSVGTKNRTYRQAAAPTAGLVTGDLWVNTTAGQNNKASRWSGTAWEDLTDPRIATAATAGAVQALDARVTAAEGVNTSQSSSITSLTNDLSALSGVVDTKATSAALASLQSTVTGQGGTITSQGTSLTTLTNKVNHASTGLDAKASSAALASLDSKVTTQGNTLTSQGTAITNLQNDLDTVEGDVATKASAAALTALTSRVTAAEGVNTSQSDSLTSLGNRMTTAEGTISSTSSALSSLTSRVTAAEGVNTSQATSITNLNTSVGTKNRTYRQAAAPTAGLVTGDIWINTTVGQNNKQSRWNGTGWDDVTDPRIATAATATAVSALDARVTAAEGVNTSQSSSITSLTNDLSALSGVVDTKATSAALASLQSTVTGQGGTITSQGTSLTTLTNKVNHASTGLDAKASSAALASLDSKVTTQGNTLTSQGTAITNLQNDLDTVEGDVATKASAAALTALTSRVTAAEGTITSQASSLTTLKSAVENPTTGLGSKASASSVQSIETRVASAEGSLSTQITALSQLQASVGDQGTKITSLQTLTEAQAQSLTSLSATVAGHGSNITALQNATADMAESLGTLETTSGFQSSKIATLEQTTASQGTRLTSVETESASNKSRISTVETTTASQGTRLTAVETKASDAISRVATVETASANHASRLGTVETTVGGHTSRISTLETTTAGQASSVTSLSARLDSTRDSNSLVPDYLMANADEWRSYYSVPLAQFFKTTAAGKVGPNVVRKEGTANFFNFSKTSVPNDRAYRLSMWARRSADASGGYYFTFSYIKPDGTFFNGPGGYFNADVSSQVTADGEWRLVSATIDQRAQAATAPRLAFGFSINHAQASGWAEMQGFKVAEVLTSADVDSSLATAAALTSLTTRVTAAEGVNTSQSGSITSLQNSVAGKADASALSALDTRVTAAEGVNTSQGSSITKLTNDLSTLSGVVDGKATSAALASLLSTVTEQAGAITSQGSSITSLTQSLETVAAQASNGSTHIGTTEPNSGRRNLHSNPSFERTGVSNMLAQYNGGVGSVVQTTAAAAGNSVLQVERTVAGSGLFGMIFPIPLPGGSDFSARVKIRMKPGAPNRAVNITPFSYLNSANVAWAKYGTGGATKVITDQWQEFVFSGFQSISGSNQAGLQIISALSWPAGDGIQLDMVLAEATATPGAWFDPYDTLWIDTTGNANTPKRWNGTAWVAATDKVAADAAAAAAAAQSTANTKADASALTALDSKVTQQGATITSQGGSITSLNNSLTTVDKLLTISDTRSVNSPPSYYWTNYPRRTVRELKFRTVVEAPGTVTYGTLETTARWTDSSGGNIIQVFSTEASLNQYTRYSTGLETWSVWKNDVRDLQATVNTKADSSAVQALDSRVTAAEGAITSQGAAVTNLQNSIGTKADSSALTSLASRVTTAEGTIASTSSALTTLTNRVTSAEGVNSAQATSISSLDNRVTSAEGTLTAQASSLTSLQSTMDARSLGLPVEQWKYLENHSIVTLTDGKVGPKALRLGVASGVGPNQGTMAQIDRSKTYRVRFWARPSADSNGALYFSLRQFLASGLGGPVADGRSPYKPQGMLRAAHNAAFGTDQWGEYNNLWTAADWQSNVTQVRPEFLRNVGGTAGYWDVQGFEFTDVTGEQVNAAATSALTTRVTSAEGLITTHTSQLTTLTTRVGAAESAIVTERNARTDGHTALSTQVNTVQATANTANAKATDATTALATLGNQVKATRNIAVEAVAGGRYAMAGISVGVEGDQTNLESKVLIKADKFEVWNGTEAQSPFAVLNGQVEMSGVKVRGHIEATSGKIGTMRIDASGLNSGGYNGYVWPANGATGIHVSENGILLGNANNGKYLELHQNGNIAGPQFSIIDGVARFGGHLEAASGSFAGEIRGASGWFSGSLSAASVITTSNLQNNSVTVPVYVVNTPSASLLLQSHASILVSFRFKPNVEGWHYLVVNGDIVKSYFTTAPQDGNFGEYSDTILHTVWSAGLYTFAVNFGNGQQLPKPDVKYISLLACQK